MDFLIFIIVICTNHIYSLIYIKPISNVDIIFSNKLKLFAADTLAKDKKYFFIIKEDANYAIRVGSFLSKNNNDLKSLISYDVTSAQSIAIDWFNYNLYWADRENRFIEIVKLNRYFNSTVGRNFRKIIISRNIANIDSIVVDPIDRYLFLLQAGKDVVLERTNLDGSGRQIIFRSNQYKSHSLTIDRHRKMLYWFEMNGQIRRVDYQGQTGCTIYIKGKWNRWQPTFLTSSNSKLLFINEDKVWSVENVHCHGDNRTVSLEINADGDKGLVPSAIVSNAPQYVKVSDEIRSSKSCQMNCKDGICAAPNCLCPSTSITLYQPCKSIKKSLLIASPPRIHQLPLGIIPPILEPILSNAGLPLQLTSDPMTSSLFFIDYTHPEKYTIKFFPFLNSTPPIEPYNITLPLNNNHPINLIFDPYSRNLYWININQFGNADLWIARVDLSDKYPKLIYSGLLIDNIMSESKLTKELICLAIDPLNQYLFITTVNKLSNNIPYFIINRYNLDGTEQYTLMKSPRLLYPRGLTLDTKNRRLFYIEKELNQIISVDYIGENRQIEVSHKFVSDTCGLTYIGGRIYWFNGDTLNVYSAPVRNSIRYNLRREDNNKNDVKVVVRMYNLQSVTLSMTSMDLSQDANPIGINVRPCGISSRGSLDHCSQLCFPARYWSNSVIGYRCGCSISNQILLSKTKFNQGSCHQLSNLKNISKIHSNQKDNNNNNYEFKQKNQLSNSTNSLILILYNSTTSFVYSLKTDTHSLSNGSLLMKSNNLNNIQLDVMRSAIYWLDSQSNCLNMSRLHQQTHPQPDLSSESSPLFISTGKSLVCASRLDENPNYREKLIQISLDYRHNNMYMLLTNQIWSRIEIVRLPFLSISLEEEIETKLWRRLIYSRMKDTDGSILSIHVHSKYRLLFIFSQISSTNPHSILLQQCDLDGSNCESIWSKSSSTSSIVSPVIDQETKYLYWFNSNCLKLFQYHIQTTITKPRDYSKHIRIYRIQRWKPFLLRKLCLNTNNMNPFFYATNNILHFWMDDGNIYQLDMNKLISTTQSKIYLTDLMKIYTSFDSSIYPSSSIYNQLPTSIRINSNNTTNFLIVIPSSSTTSSINILATLSNNHDKNSKTHFIQCPSSSSSSLLIQNNKQLVLCQQFCLPTTQQSCACSSQYLGVNPNKHGVCLDNKSQMTIVTRDGELITHEIDINNPSSFTNNNWYSYYQNNNNNNNNHLIDSIYWHDIILNVDSDGQLSWYNPLDSNTAQLIKRLKLNALNDDTIDDIDDISTYESYDKLYRHLLEETNKQVLQNDPRYRLAVDMVTDTLFWSDWVKGVIVSEQIEFSTIEKVITLKHQRIVLDLRKSNRRPLELAVCSVTGTLIWLSGLLTATVPSASQQRNRRNSMNFWRDYLLEISDFDGAHQQTLMLHHNERPRSLHVESGTSMIYWSSVDIENDTVNIYSLHITWNHYKIRAGYGIGKDLNLTLTRYISLDNHDPRTTVIPITVYNDRVYFLYESSQINETSSKNDRYEYFYHNNKNNKKYSTLQTYLSSVDKLKNIYYYEWNYLNYKRKGIIKLLIKQSKYSYINSLLGLARHYHPCSTIFPIKPCSHLCISTFLFGLDVTAIRSILQSLKIEQNSMKIRTKYRCSCPKSLLISNSNNTMNNQQICLFKKHVKQCPTDSFSCRNGPIIEGNFIKHTHCLQSTFKCDSNEDCLDGSDESNCDYKKPIWIQPTFHYSGPCNVTHQFSCRNNNNKLVCFPLKFMCDGIIHCADRSDENCCDFKSQFQCLSGIYPTRCISKRLQCDSVIDCIDSSDELNCTPLSFNAPNLQLLQKSFIFLQINANKNTKPNSYFNWPIFQLKSSNNQSNLAINKNPGNTKPTTNNTVAIICGSIGGTICLLALLYLTITTISQRLKSTKSYQTKKHQKSTKLVNIIKRKQHKDDNDDLNSSPSQQHHHYHHHHYHHHHQQNQHHHYYQQHQSQIFQTHNVNMIMLVSSPGNSSSHSNKNQQYYYSNGGEKRSNNTYYFNENSPGNGCYGNESANAPFPSNNKYESNLSLSSSLSECYRRIRDPLPIVATLPPPPPPPPPPTSSKSSSESSSMTARKLRQPAAAPPLFTSRDYGHDLFGNTALTYLHRTNSINTSNKLIPLPIPPAPSSNDDDDDDFDNGREHRNMMVVLQHHPPPPPSLVSKQISFTNESVEIGTRDFDDDEDEGLPVAPRNSRVTSTAVTSTDDDEDDENDDNNNKQQLLLPNTANTNNHDYPNCVFQGLLTAASVINDNNNNNNNNTSSRHTSSILYRNRHQKKRTSKNRRNHRHRYHRNQHYSNTESNNSNSNHSSYLLPPPPSPNSISNSNFNITPL